jgi:ABC-2 type transport system ATP-binding protein
VADRRVGGFSLGMRQRLGLAAALLGEPAVLILDEPTNGLDPDGIRWIRGLLRGLAGEGRTVLVSSHVLAEVAQTVDTVVVLNRGRLIAQTSLHDLMAEAGQVVQVRTGAAERLSTALGAEGAQVTVVDGDRLAVTGTTAERVGRLAAELSIPLFESTTQATTLEDVFFQLTAGPAGKEPPR